MPIYKLTDPELKKLEGVHLYDEPFSNNCMRVRMYLEEMNIPYVKHAVRLAKKENYDPSYLRINPDALVPALVYEGKSIANSNEIVKFLHTEFGGKGEQFEVEDKRLMWDWVNRAGEIHFETIKAFLFVNRLGRPCSPSDLEFYRKNNVELYQFHLEYTNVTPEKRKEVMDYNHQVIRELDDLLKQRRYLLSDHFSLVDIAWVPNLYFFERMNFDLSEYTHVRRWMNEIRKRPSYSKSRLPNIPFWMFKLVMSWKWRKVETSK